MSASTTAWLLLTVAVLASVTQNIAEGRGSCPLHTSVGRPCLVYRNKCTSSADCKRGQECCLVAGCRRKCVNVVTHPRCPLLESPGVLCITFINQCTTSADCSDRPGHSCCPGYCGRECKDVSKTAPTDERCTFANTYGHQCETSKDCRSSADCSGGPNHSCCHVRECGRQQCTDVSEPPTDRRCSLLENPGYECIAFINQCRTSADCSDRPGHSCCPGDCGRVCKDVSKTALTDPRCTFANTYGHQCETSKDCRRSAQCSGGPNHSCCHVRECGRQQCTDVSEPPTDRRCPESWVYGIRCSDYIDECKSIVDCRHKPGTNCCLVSGCGHKCKDISRYTTNPINVPQPVPFRG